MAHTSRPADETSPAAETRPADGPRSQRLPRWAIAAGVAAIVFWQVIACFRMFDADPPPVPPFPISQDLATDMRERITEAKSKKGPFAIDIGERELTSYIVGRLQSGPGEFPARDMQIRFEDGYAEIWATFIDVAPSDIPVYIRATIGAEGGQVVFYIDQASAGPLAIPGAMRELISQVLTETLSELEYGLVTERAEIIPGRLILQGQVTGDIPDLP